MNPPIVNPSPRQIARTRLAPLHIGKRVPPPYAGIEAHIDALLRSIADVADSTLVATEGSAKLCETPYRILASPTYGSVASVQLSPGVLRSAAAELRSGRCNLLHLHAPNPWGDLAALALAKDVPVVMTWHSDIVSQKSLLRLYGPLQRRAIRRADRVIVFTPKHYESSRQLRPLGVESKLVSIPIGVDFSWLDTVSVGSTSLNGLDRWCGGRPMLLTVGRQVPYKGYTHLLNAMAALHSDAVLVMVGTGPLGGALRSQAEALGLGERVRFLGEVDRPMLAALFHRCDVFTLPSIEPSEAFGIATAEAMACAKPAVVCELGNGVNYLTRHEHTGLAVAPRDERALAAALDLLLRDDALRSRFGAAASTWVRNEFSTQRMRDGTIALYKSLL